MQWHHILAHPRERGRYGKRRGREREVMGRENDSLQSIIVIIIIIIYLGFTLMGPN